MSYYDDHFVGAICFHGSKITDEDGNPKCTKEHLEIAKNILCKIQEKISKIEGVTASFDFDILEGELPKDFISFVSEEPSIYEWMDEDEYEKNYVLYIHECMRTCGTIKYDIESEDGKFHELMSHPELKWKVAGLGCNSLDDTWIYECYDADSSGASEGDEDGILEQKCDRVNAETEEWYNDEDEDEE